MVYGFFLLIHVLVALVMVVTVLLQSGKGGGLAGAFGGGGGSQAIFGGRGAATFLSKATTILGTSFMLTSLILAMLQTHTGGEQSALEREAERAAEMQFTLPAPGEGPLQAPAVEGEGGDVAPAPATGGGVEGTPPAGGGEAPGAGSGEDPGGG